MMSASLIALIFCDICVHGVHIQIVSSGKEGCESMILRVISLSDVFRVIYKLRDPSCGAVVSGYNLSR